MHVFLDPCCMQHISGVGSDEVDNYTGSKSILESMMRHIERYAERLKYHVKSRHYGSGSF